MFPIHSKVLPHIHLGKTREKYGLSYLSFTEISVAYNFYGNQNDVLAKHTCASRLDRPRGGSIQCQAFSVFFLIFQLNGPKIQLAYCKPVPLTYTFHSLVQWCETFWTFLKTTPFVRIITIFALCAKVSTKTRITILNSAP